MDNFNPVERLCFRGKPQEAAKIWFLSPTRVVSKRVFYNSNACNMLKPYLGAFLRLGFQPEPKPPPSCDYLRRRRSTTTRTTANKPNTIRHI